MKAEVCIDSGTLGMEFFLDPTLPQFNQAGSCLEMSWPKAFFEFKNVLGDSYRTTWQEVLAEHFSEPLGKEATNHREPEAAAGVGARAPTEGNRQRTGDGGEGGHPRVWLQISGEHGWVECPYCDAKLVHKDFEGKV